MKFKVRVKVKIRPRVRRGRKVRAAVEVGLERRAKGRGEL